MPRLEDWEIKKYWEIFQGLKPVDSKLTGDRVSPVLKNSRLPDDQLKQIWDLSDIDADGKLDFEEFCITMRIIFDLVNGKLHTIPEELPNWLIPSSKAHLIQANRAVSSGSNNGYNDAYSNDDEEEDSLSDDFDWYISPTDKATYEVIYNTNSDSLGRVRFDSLNKLYATLTKVPQSDISSAWNLVNPKSFETIDKDQVLVFLHILNQREHGKRVPRGVPASLRATFSKEAPNYDVKAQSTNSTISNSKSSNTGGGRNSFANDYLSKIGQSSSITEKGTDFSATEGTDWEEARLRRELADLDNLLKKAQAQKDNRTNDDCGDLSMIRYEFEQLLKYKQDKLHKYRSNSGGDKDLVDVKNDIELIESQVTTLEQYLNDKNNELMRLNQEIAGLKQ
jgi:hypothetical protein